MTCFFWSCNVAELSYSFVFEPECDNESPNRGHGSLPTNMLGSGILSPPCSPCQCAEYLLRISDLECRLSLLKRQAKSALDQAGRSYSLMR
jgi:hypothetical protein